MAYLSSYQGDYLRASRERGDPLFGLLAGAIPFVKKGISVVRRLLPKRAPPGLGAFVRGAAPTAVLAGATLAAGRMGAPRAAPGAGGKRKRMNVANPKALRRAIRRTDGFVKLARRTLKGTGFVIARRGFSKAARARRR